MRVFIEHDPFLNLTEARPWQERGIWPCSWIGSPEAGAPPFVAAYRLRFSLEQATAIRVHVSADERYELFLDGRRIGRGPEQGAPDCWFYETYDMPFEPGNHVIVARVWALGSRAGLAQMSVRPGFLFAAEGDWGTRLNTGAAPWEACVLSGYSFLNPAPAHWRGANVCINGATFPWGFEQGKGDDWHPVATLGRAIGWRMDWEFQPHHVLRPATLPPMERGTLSAGRVRLIAEVASEDTSPVPVRATDHLMQEMEAWQSMLAGSGTVTLAPHHSRRILIDLENYYCAYPEILTSGGAGGTVRVHWAESLFHERNPLAGWKGNRDEVEGKYFIGIGDTFLPDGGSNRRFGPLWWHAGRYIELFVQAAEQPLQIEAFTIHETRYPLEMESAFYASDTRLDEIMPLLVRGMQMDAHEVFADSPYYEQLMYAGDARLEALTTYVMSVDDRLARKALRMFDVSRLPSGLTYSRYPSRQLQIISSWSLWWVGMVCDYARWRDDRAYVEGLMPGVRATMEGFRRWFSADGMLHGPEGWNNFDWVRSWEAGMPPDAAAGVSGVINWQLVYMLGLVADLEEQLGEAELAARGRRQAAELAARLIEAFWVEERGVLADDLAHNYFSEHTQVMALLSKQLSPALHTRVAEGLLADQHLERATIYFSHYLFEVYGMLGRVDVLLKRLELWFDLKAKGLCTPIESPEPSRSDCHAWSSHPLYHYFATILGIRPAGLGFHAVEIAPQLGPLSAAGGKLVHPCGEIVVDFRVEDGLLHGKVELPEGVSGTLHWNGARIPLWSGQQQLEGVNEEP